jgi:hypothetical protein
VSYLLTIEPTASFWDCPEFISQGFKLEVGHPPGNPIFMLTARFFINFVGGEPGKVAMAVNSMNALLSAGTILLLFWTVTHLMRRLLVTDDNLANVTPARAITIFASGVVGALAYAWSDTFWFSAVEGEVYAFSSFCTALVFWLILKWENRADKPHSDRFLVLIAYVIGVSIAVHLLNLLCIPAIVLVFYYKKFANPTAKGSCIALLVSFAIVALILYGLVPGFVEVAQYFDLFFVNTLGLSYNTGVVFYAFATLAVFIWSIYELYTQRSASRIKWSFVLAILFSGIPFIGSSLLIPVVIVIALLVWLNVVKLLPVRVLNLISLSTLVIFIGYSSYALLLIRSSAETPVNQNAPDNVFSLASYLNREQYGENPLFYGTTFTSEVLRDSQGSAISHETYGYAKAVKTSADTPDHYDRIVTKTKYDYVPEQNMLFPRIYSSQYATSYMQWIGMDENDLSTVMATTTDGSTVKTAKKRPTFAQNLTYFVNYQLVHMYFRYFMWNFAGRQNDFQGNGEVNRGNWISGFSFIDNPRLGNQSLLPKEYGTGNKGHNVFFMLPLLLGVVGLLWQSVKGERGIQQFWVVFFLFFMTGIAIVLYLNQTPNQPRERDYAYAGSFYAFAIWIGLGVGALWEGLSKLLKKQESLPAAIAAAVIGLIVPLQMVSQTWDDHDRSGRYTTRDFGMNYLYSLDPNAIIFTNGDNDTFPLWYAQEVEGVRTDVRVVNLSYLTTDWYAAQQLKPAYDAPAIEMQATVADLGQERRQSGYVMQADTLVSVESFLRNYYSDQPDRIAAMYGVNYPITEAGALYIPIDAKAAMAAGRISPSDTIYEIPDAIYIDLISAISNKNHQSIVTQGDVLCLDILNTSIQNGWKRPIYFANTVPNDYYLGLDPYMFSTGMAHEVSPMVLDDGSSSQARNDKAYENITKRFRWGGLDAPDAEKLYLDETVCRMISSTRYAMLEVVRSLYAAGDYQRALDILNLLVEKLPAKVLPYGVQCGDEIAAYFVDLGDQLNNDAATERGLQLYRDEIMHYAEYMPYLASLSPSHFRSLQVADRAVVHIRDSQGDYSYLLSLVAQYMDAVGEDATLKFLQEVQQKTGVNLAQYLKS